MTHTGQDQSQTLAPATQQFLLWCLEAFGLRVSSDDATTYRFQWPDEFEGPAPDPSLRQVLGEGFTFQSTPSGGVAGPLEHVTLQSPLFHWLVEQLRGPAGRLSAMAARQPVSVHELTEKLYAPYQVDGGHTSLAGCSLEDRPFLRLTYLDRDAEPPENQLTHVFADSDGRLLDGDFHNRLDLHDLKPLQGRSPRVAANVVDDWTTITRQQCETPRLSRAELLATTLVWCKYVEARLAFTIGRHSVELAVDGWARLFVDQLVKPPPYACPLSHMSSYHLAATDDGRITVAEAIATCQESGRRVLEIELETCSVTGQRVLPAYLQNCPVSELPVMRSELKRCSVCQQTVSPLVLTDGRCRVCRGIKSIKKDDPRMARVLGEYPQLDRLRSWRLSESQTMYVLVASSLLKRLLLVVDKQTLEVTRLASSGAFSRRWTDADEPLRAEWLGQRT